MTGDASQVSDLVSQFRAGNAQALADLYAHYRARLRRMVSLRLDRRLRGRFDASDVLQEAWLDAQQRAAEYAQNPSMPFYLWLRFLTVQRLAALHRRHLQAQMRDAGQEVSLYQGALPEADSASLAAQLLGQETSPTQAAVRAEMQLKLQAVLNSMEPMDREILALRHFEELSNSEIAEVLGLQKSAASNRYIRALKRLKDALGTMPGFLSG